MGERFDSFELPLTECDAGEEGQVVSLDIDTGLGARLRELGLVPGASVRVVRGGLPLIVEVGNARLCLRGEDVSGVMIRVSIRPVEAAALAGAGLNLSGTDLV